MGSGNRTRNSTSKGTRPRAGRVGFNNKPVPEALRAARRKFITKSIGAEIARQREQRGISTAELATQSGIDEIRLVGFERADDVPFVDELPRIADALEVSPMVFLECYADLGQFRANDTPEEEEP